MITLSNQLITKLAVWLLAEILLNLLGLDNLADYSEFIFTKAFSPNRHIQIVHIQS